MRMAVLVRFLVNSLVVLGVGLGLNPALVAQEGGGASASSESEASAPESQLRGTVVTLDLGLLDSELQAYEIGEVTEGPPDDKPIYFEISGQSVGLSVGILDRQQQVVEVHLFQAAGEPLAQLLVEPDIAGYAELSDSQTVVVAIRGIREAAGQ